MVARTKGKTISTTPRVQPINTLTPAALKIFNHTVSAVDPSHFSDVDLPLLQNFANAAALANEASAQIDLEGAVVGGKANPWLSVQERASKQLVALSARLRICPQSRFDRLVAGSNSRPQLDRFASDDDDLLAKSEDKFFRGTK